MNTDADADADAGASSPPPPPASALLAALLQDWQSHADARTFLAQRRQRTALFHAAACALDSGAGSATAEVAATADTDVSDSDANAAAAAAAAGAGAAAAAASSSVVPPVQQVKQVLTLCRTTIDGLEGSQAQLLAAGTSAAPTLPPASAFLFGAFNGPVASRAPTPSPSAASAVRCIDVQGMMAQLEAHAVAPSSDSVTSTAALLDQCDGVLTAAVCAVWHVKARSAMALAAHAAGRDADGTAPAAALITELQRPYRLPISAQRLDSDSIASLFRTAWTAVLAFAISVTLINAALPLLHPQHSPGPHGTDTGAATSGAAVPLARSRSQSRLLSHVVARFQHSMQLRDFLTRSWHILSAAVDKREQAARDAEADAALPSFCKSAAQLLEEAERPAPAETSAKRWQRQLLLAMQLAPRVHPQLLALMLRAVHEAPPSTSTGTQAPSTTPAPSPLPLARGASGSGTGTSSGGGVVGRANDEAARRLPFVQLYTLATAASPVGLGAPAAASSALAESSSSGALLALWSRLRLGADIALTLAAQLDEEDGPHTLQDGAEGNNGGGLRGGSCLSRATERALCSEPVLRALVSYGAGALWFENAARDVVQGVEYGGGNVGEPGGADGVAGFPVHRGSKLARSSSGNVAVLGMVSAAAGGEDAPAHSLTVKRREKRKKKDDDDAATSGGVAASHESSDASSAASSNAPSPFPLVSSVGTSASVEAATTGVAAATAAAATAADAATPTLADPSTAGPASSNLSSPPPCLSSSLFSSFDCSSFLCPVPVLDVGDGESEGGDGDGSASCGRYTPPRYPHTVLAREVPLLAGAHHAVLARLLGPVPSCGTDGDAEDPQPGPTHDGPKEEVLDSILAACGLPVDYAPSTGVGGAGTPRPSSHLSLSLSLGPFAFANLFNVYQVRRDSQRLMQTLMPRPSLDTAVDGLCVQHPPSDAGEAAPGEQDQARMSPRRLAKLRALQRHWAPQVSRCSDALAALQALQVMQSLSCLPRGGGVSPSSLLAPLVFPLPVPSPSGSATSTHLSLSYVLGLHSHLLRLYAMLVSSSSSSNSGGGGSSGGACSPFYPEFVLRIYVRRVVPVLQVKLRQLVAHEFRPRQAQATTHGATSTPAAHRSGANSFDEEEDAERLEQELVDEEALAAAVEDSAADMLALANDSPGDSPTDAGSDLGRFSPVAQLLWVSMARSSAGEGAEQSEYLLAALGELHRQRWGLGGSGASRALPPDELHHECKGVGFSSACVVFEAVAHAILLALCRALPVPAPAPVPAASGVRVSQDVATADASAAVPPVSDSSTAPSPSPPSEDTPPAPVAGTEAEAGAGTSLSPEFVLAFQSLHRCEHELREVLSLPLASGLQLPPTVSSALRGEVGQLRRDIEAAHVVYDLGRFEPLAALHSHVYEGLVLRSRPAGAAASEDRRVSERHRSSSSTAAAAAVASSGGHIVPALRPRPASFFLAALGDDVHALERVRVAREREAIAARKPSPSPSPPPAVARSSSSSRGPSLPTVRPVQLLASGSGAGAGTRKRRPAHSPPGSASSAGSDSSTSSAGARRRRPEQRHEEETEENSVPQSVPVPPSSTRRARVAPSSAAAAAPAIGVAVGGGGESSARKRLKLELMASPRRTRDAGPDADAGHDDADARRKLSGGASPSSSPPRRRSAQKKRKALHPAARGEEWDLEAGDGDEFKQATPASRSRRHSRTAATATATSSPSPSNPALSFLFPLSDDDE